MSSSRELITELSMGSREEEEEEGNVFHGRSGCGRTRGWRFFLCCFMFIFFHDGLKWCWHNVIPVQCSECQSGEKLETSAGERQEKPWLSWWWPRLLWMSKWLKTWQCDFRSDTDEQIVRYIQLRLFPSGKASDWRNRQHVVLDLQCRQKWLPTVFFLRAKLPKLVINYLTGFFFPGGLFLNLVIITFRFRSLRASFSSQVKNARNRFYSLGCRFWVR